MAMSFNEAFYLENNPDVAAAIEAGIIPSAQFHFDNFGWQEGRNPNPFFDVSYYLSENPDVAEAGVNPLEHFLAFGASEGRKPFAEFVSRNEFDAETYLANNPDLEEAGITSPEDLYAHFATFGFAEERSGVQTNDGQTITEGRVVTDSGEPDDPDVLDPDDPDPTDPGDPIVTFGIRIDNGEVDFTGNATGQISVTITGDSVSFTREGVTATTSLTKTDFLDFQFNLAPGDTLSVPDGKFKLIQDGKAWFEENIVDFTHATGISVTPTTSVHGGTINWLRIEDTLTIVGGDSATFNGQVIVTANNVSLSNITFEIDPAAGGPRALATEKGEGGNGFILVKGKDFEFSNNTVIAAGGDLDALGVTGIATLKIIGGGFHTVTGNQFDATQPKDVNDADTIWIGNGSANVSFNTIDANGNGGILFWGPGADPVFAENSVIQGNVITNATVAAFGDEPGIRLFEPGFTGLDTNDLNITIVGNSTNGQPYVYTGDMVFG